MFTLTEREMTKFSMHVDSAILAHVSTGQPLTQSVMALARESAYKLIQLDREQTKQFASKLPTLKNAWDRLYPCALKRQSFDNAEVVSIIDTTARQSAQSVKALSDILESAYNAMRANAYALTMAIVCKRYKVSQESIELAIPTLKVSHTCAVVNTASNENCKTAKDKAETAISESKKKTDWDMPKTEYYSITGDVSKLRKDTADKLAQLPVKFTAAQYKTAIGFNLNLSKCGYISKSA